MTEGISRRGDDLSAIAQNRQAMNRFTLLQAQQEQKELVAVGRLSDALNAAVGRATTGGTPSRPNIATGDAPKRRPEPGIPVFKQKSDIGHGLDLNRSTFVSLPCWVIDNPRISPVDWKAENYVNNSTSTIGTIQDGSTFRAYSLNRLAFEEDVVTFPPISAPDNSITVTTVNEPGGLPLITRVTMTVAEAIGVDDVLSHKVLVLPTGNGNCIITITGSIERTIHRASDLKSHIDISYLVTTDPGPDLDTIAYWENEYAEGRPGDTGSRGYIYVYDAVTPPSTTTSTTTTTDFTFTYLCSATRVKKLTVPATYASTLAAFSIPLTQSNKSLGFYKFGGVNVKTWTPEIFKTLNDVSEFVDPSLTKSFPSDSDPILTDTQRGFYSYVSYLPTPSDVQSLYYARWTGDPGTVDPSETLYYADLPTETKNVPFLPSDLEIHDNQTQTLHAAWDWGDRTYCRAMCLALGFTTADLVP